jgi:two-component system, OmpR family, response regulator
MTPVDPVPVVDGGRIRALLIEDDARLAQLTARYLDENQVETRTARDGQIGLVELERAAFDVVLLDLMLPGLDGLEVCRRIRRRSPLPIIMLTARGDDADKVVGLELGADDYVTKPFNPRELLARIRAVVRRVRGERGPNEVITVGELRIDRGARVCTVRGAPRDLTAYEFELLAVLAESAGRVLSREQLGARLRGEPFDTFDRSIDVHVSKLRQKIEEDPRHPRWLKTVRGVGYVLARD